MPNNDGIDIDQDIDLSNGEPATLEAAKKRVSGILSDLKTERVKRQDLEKRLQSIEDREKLAEEEKLKQQGELQKLVDAKQKEIDELKSQSAVLKSKADEFDLLEQQERETAKKTLGEKYDPDYDNIPIKTLRKIISTISTPNAIEMDSGGGQKPKPTELSETEKAQAKQMGLSEDAFKQFKKRQEELKASKEKK